MSDFDHTLRRNDNQIRLTNKSLHDGSCTDVVLIHIVRKMITRTNEYWRDDGSSMM